MPKPIKEAKETELTQGKNPDGTPIGKYRSPAYAKEKNVMNPVAGFGNVDLILSGRFKNSLFPYRTGGNRYLFGNSVDYGRELIEKYGQGVTGLSQTEFNRLQRDYYKKYLVRFIKKQIGQ